MVLRADGALLTSEALVHGVSNAKVVMADGRQVTGTVAGSDPATGLAVVKVPVVSWDERFTSVMATQALIEGGMSRRDRRHVVDKVSATLILQSYLDYRKVADAEATEPPV